MSKKALSQADIQRRNNAVQKWADEVATARAEDSILMMEWYCDSDADCPAREIRIKVKDYDTTLVSRLKRGVICCPLCSGPLKMHWVQTSSEHRSFKDQSARVSVNIQMWERDVMLETGNAVVGVSADMFRDDRLPPTPDGWFSEQRQPLPKRRRFVRKGEE